MCNADEERFLHLVVVIIWLCFCAKRNFFCVCVSSALMQKSCTRKPWKSIFKPASHQQGWLRVHECVVVEAAAATVAAVANGLRVHCNHCNASSFEDFHCDFDCFSFCLYSLGHTLVRQVSPEIAQNH